MRGTTDVGKDLKAGVIHRSAEWKVKRSLDLGSELFFLEILLLGDPALEIGKWHHREAAPHQPCKASGALMGGRCVTLESALIQMFLLLRRHHLLSS